MNERVTVTILADGGVIIGAPPSIPTKLANAGAEAIEKYLASDHADGQALLLPFAVEVDDQRFVSEQNPEESELQPVDQVPRGLGGDTSGARSGRPPVRGE